MRPISYRAKGHDGKWWYGRADVQTDARKRIVSLATFFMHLYALDFDPKTIGAYIGVKDVNGKRLYAGDIVQVANATQYVVEYDNSTLTWWAWDYRAWWQGYYDAYEPLKDIDTIVPDDCTPPCVPELHFHTLKCVGNIYDNPDGILICSRCEYFNKCDVNSQKPDYCPKEIANGKYWYGVMPAGQKGGGQ